MSDYIPIRTIRPHWRNVFDDGTVLDLYPEPERMAEEVRKVGEDLDAVQAFLRYSARLYDLVDWGYFQQGLDTVADFRAFYGLATFPQFDLFRTMHRGVARHVRTKYFRDVFDFFVKYVGSSAYRAPAFMNCLPTLQFRHDLWYVDGGMYNIARGLGRLMQELGITVHVGTEVVEIRKANARVTGVGLTDGTLVSADFVVCNMEVIPPIAGF